jgi:hypothetical protein
MFFHRPKEMENHFSGATPVPYLFTHPYSPEQALKEAHVFSSRQQRKPVRFHVIRPIETRESRTGDPIFI